MPVPNCLEYCGFVIELEVREHNPPSFILPSQDGFGYSGSFVVPYEFQFVEECCWYFDRDCFESVDCFRQDGHFDNIASYP